MNHFQTFPLKTSRAVVPFPAALSISSRQPKLSLRRLRTKYDSLAESISWLTYDRRNYPRSRVTMEFERFLS